MSKQNRFIALSVAFLVFGQFAGCQGSDDPADADRPAPVATVDAETEFFNATKGEVAQRLEAISSWLDDNGNELPESMGQPPALSRESSFVVAADSVDSFISVSYTHLTLPTIYSV